MGIFSEKTKKIICRQQNKLIDWTLLIIIINIVKIASQSISSQIEDLSPT